MLNPIPSPDDINRLVQLRYFPMTPITIAVGQYDKPASAAVSRLLHLLSDRWLDETAIEDSTSKRCAILRASLLIVAFGIGLQDTSPAVAAPGIQPWNTTCNRIYSQWKKKPNHKAFTVANSSAGQACGGSWSANSIKAAEESALKACKKASEEAHCSIVKSE
jgi:hypothetical protein